MPTIGGATKAAGSGKASGKKLGGLAQSIAKRNKVEPKKPSEVEEKKATPPSSQGDEIEEPSASNPSKTSGSLPIKRTNNNFRKRLENKGNQ